ncbi:hypothetical protein [Kaarinaea lacus]
MLWILSEIFYYAGLVLTALVVPGLAFSLWMLSLAGRVDPNFWYLLIAWLVSVLMFLAGVGLKRLLYK